jgi:membrane protease YdiL (CAAX protease family)
LPFPLHPNFWWGILWCIGLLLFTQIPGAVVAIVILFGAMLFAPGLLPPDAGGDSKALFGSFIGQLSLGSALLTAHGLIILFAVLLLRILAGRDWPRQVALRLPSAAHVGLVLAAVPAFVVLGNGVYHFLRDVLLVPSLARLGVPGMEEMEGVFSGWLLPAAVFIIGVLPAISEELWCRAFLGRGLVGTHGVILGVLGTSFLFGLIHVDPCQGLMALVLGVLLHFIYLTTRSLLIPMLMHFMNNALAVTLPRIAILEKLDKLPDNQLIGLYVGSAVLLLAVCLALYQSRTRLVSTTAEPAWQPPYPGVVCPPPGSGTRVEAPLPSPLSVALVAAGLIAFAVGITLAIQQPLER